MHTILTPKGLVLLEDFTDKCQYFDSNHLGSELGNKLLDFSRMKDLHQLISEPTMVTGASTRLLDLIMVDCPGIMVDSGVSLPIDVDHHGVLCTLTLKWNQPGVYKGKMYNYSSVNYILLREAISYAPWDAGIDLFDDSDDCVGHFTTSFISIIDGFVPNKIVQVGPKDKEWMTGYIHYLINRRDRL